MDHSWQVTEEDLTLMATLNRLETSASSKKQRINKIYTPPSTPNFICLVNSYRNLSGSSLEFLISEDKDKCKGSTRPNPNPIQDPIPIPARSHAMAARGSTRHEVSCCVSHACASDCHRAAVRSPVRLRGLEHSRRARRQRSRAPWRTLTRTCVHRHPQPPSPRRRHSRLSPMSS
jgi:hypothetical protein